MPGRRPERIAEQLKEEVSQIILGELRDPRLGLATVTDVNVSPDLRHARVFVSVLGSDKTVSDSLDVLNTASGYIRQEVGRAIRLRYTPQLHFVFDKVAQTANRIEEILKEEGERAREREQEADPASSHP